MTAPEPAGPSYTYRPPIGPQPLADVRLALPDPPPPGRIRQSVFLVLLVIVTLAGGAGGYLLAYAPGGATPAAGAHATGPARLVPSPGPSPAPTRPGDGAALHAKLIPAPAGARILDDGTPGDVYDLEAYTSCCLKGGQSDRWYVNARGFEFMTNRRWISGSVTYEVQLLKFATSTGATSQQRAAMSDSAESKDVSAHFGVTGVPGAEGFTFNYSDGTDETAMVARVGDVVVRVFAHATFAPGRATATALLRRQLARLR